MHSVCKAYALHRCSIIRFCIVPRFIQELLTILCHSSGCVTTKAAHKRTAQTFLYSLTFAANESCELGAHTNLLWVCDRHIFDDHPHKCYDSLNSAMSEKWRVQANGVDIWDPVYNFSRIKLQRLWVGINFASHAKAHRRGNAIDQIWTL